MLDYEFVMNLVAIGTVVAVALFIYGIGFWHGEWYGENNKHEGLREERDARMVKQGVGKLGVEYKRTDNDFHFRWLEADNCACSICHGIGAKIEFRYVTRNYESARRKGKICKNLQAHEHSFWICPECIKNLERKKKLCEEGNSAGRCVMYEPGMRACTGKGVEKC